MDSGKGLRRFLEGARSAFEGGDPTEAERHAKALSALVRAERDVAEFIGANDAGSEEHEEELRAELRRRIARFVDAASAGAPDQVLERIATGRAAG